VPSFPSLISLKIIETVAAALSFMGDFSRFGHLEDLKDPESK
jgi:hypothetical protein